MVSMATQCCLEDTQLWVSCVHVRGCGIASFPGLPTIQFLIAYSMQKQRRKAWSILSREQCRSLPKQTERRWESPTERVHFAVVFFVLNNERCVFCFANIWNCSTWLGSTKKASISFFRLGPLPPSVYLG